MLKGDVDENEMRRRLLVEDTQLLFGVHSASLKRWWHLITEVYEVEPYFE